MKLLKDQIAHIIVAVGIVVVLGGVPSTSPDTSAIQLPTACPSGMVSVAQPTSGAQYRGRCFVSYGPFGLRLTYDLYQTPLRYEGVLVR